ncbi:YggS family pyridoxal phosphate-dependent enzyme [Cellulomonas soli]|uniref:YggS family pyridoxal phosphate-dependent enzyme n=1 Tax=Cellulomonas soli TaxID=931535 RepID=UPI003F837B06
MTGTAPVSGESIDERLAAVRSRLAAACAAADRPTRAVRLLLASKTVAAEGVRAALHADARARTLDPDLVPVLLGENRVQELVEKAPALADLAPDWHVIGPLQTNKVNAALRWAGTIESVATLDLARRLSDRCQERAVPLAVHVQVNVSGEPTKHGIHPGDAHTLAVQVAALPGLRLTGFMTVGANSPDLAAVRAGYALLRTLRDDVLACGAPGTAGAVELSMGMSRDLEAAVAEGATIVRIGSAVFGARTR